MLGGRYYPPRTEDGTRNLVKRFHKMNKQGPAYGDMTWGAGGSTSDLTLELCTTVRLTPPTLPSPALSPHLPAPRVSLLRGSRGNTTCVCTWRSISAAECGYVAVFTL